MPGSVAALAGVRKEHFIFKVDNNISNWNSAYFSRRREVSIQAVCLHTGKKVTFNMVAQNRGREQFMGIEKVCWMALDVSEPQVLAETSPSTSKKIKIFKMLATI